MEFLLLIGNCDSAIQTASPLSNKVNVVKINFSTIEEILTLHDNISFRKRIDKDTELIRYVREWRWPALANGLSCNMSSQDQPDQSRTQLRSSFGHAAFPSLSFKIASTATVSSDCHPITCYKAFGIIAECQDGGSRRWSASREADHECSRREAEPLRHGRRQDSGSKRSSGRGAWRLGRSADRRLSRRRC